MILDTSVHICAVAVYRVKCGGMKKVHTTARSLFGGWGKFNEMPTKRCTPRVDRSVGGRDKQKVAIQQKCCPFPTPAIRVLRFHFSTGLRHCHYLVPFFAYYFRFSTGLYCYQTSFDMESYGGRVVLGGVLSRFC